MINARPILNVIGVLLMVIGLLMWTGILFSWYFQSQDAMHLFNAGLLTSITGLFLWQFKGGKNNSIGKREGYLIVAFGWLAMIVFGMLPYLFSGTLLTFTDAIFETVSGMTTTGASVLTDIEQVPAGILYWRSMTQWIGGMGIIVLTVAIFPILGIGGIELFSAEAPGPTSDKIHPRIRETAKRLWILYVSLTFVLLVILYFAGMTFYDAVNHALTTMATGGFSTKNASMAAYDVPIIQYPIILFMFIAGMNYSIIYLSIKGKWRKVWQNDEFRTYSILVLVLSFLVAASVYQVSGLPVEKAFRDSLFQIVSLITTTGFVSADYTTWTPSLTFLCFILMFSGASAGSTSGGIKIIRHLVYFKNSYLEFKRILHPRAIIPLKLNGQIVGTRIATHIYVFLMVYLMIFILSCLIVSMMGLDFMTTLGAVATSLGNVGPGLGKVGPVDNFAWLPEQVKLFLAFIMLLGRLELFTILVLFTPYFWK